MRMPDAVLVKIKCQWGGKMQPRIELKIRDKVVAQILCDTKIADGDLVIMLDEVVQNLRWKVTQMAVIHYIKPAVEG